VTLTTIITAIRYLELFELSFLYKNVEILAEAGSAYFFYIFYSLECSLCSSNTLQNSR